MSWKLEIAKMFMYISFPVGVFHYFNQPANFEEWVIKTKKEYFPVESKQLHEEMEDFIHEYNAVVEKHQLDEIERQHKNK